MSSIIVVIVRDAPHNVYNQHYNRIDHVFQVTSDLSICIIVKISGKGGQSATLHVVELIHGVYADHVLIADSCINLINRWVSLYNGMGNLSV